MYPLIFRANSWSLPGGAVGDKETIYEAAEREILEETYIWIHKEDRVWMQAAQEHGHTYDLACFITRAQSSYVPTNTAKLAREGFPPWDPEHYGASPYGPQYV